MNKFQQRLLDDLDRRAQGGVRLHMTTHPVGHLAGETFDRDMAKERFRLLFQRSLHGCLRHGFPLPEAFGLIFTETLESVPLDAASEQELYLELLHWARSHLELS